MKELSASVKGVLYKSTPTATGKYPVKIRVTYARESKYYSLGVFAEALNAAVDPPVIDYGRKADNDKIRTQLKKAQDAVNKIAEMNKDFTFALFETEYKQTRSPKLEASAFIDGLVKALQDEERFSTANTYKDCRNSLEGYRKGVKLYEIDSDFLEKYTRHLHKRLSPASVGIHLRTLRAVVNAAISKRLLSKDSYPFKDFKGIPNNRARSKKALTKERIQELFAYWRKLGKKHKYESRWQSLSLFLFSYFVAGINLEDILRLTPKNLHDGNLRFVRKKTTQEIEVPLHEIAAEILADFSTVRDNGFLFPFLDKGLPEKTLRHRKLNLLKEINADLKAISDELGMPTFTFYSARHSFASVLHNQKVATSHIGEYLGHTSEKTTKNYLASIETERKKEAFGNLI